MLSRQSKVAFREITAETVLDICALAVREDQRRYVANNAKSIAQAYFSEHAWFRAVYAGDIAIGFVMLEEQPEKPEYYLWRFMIDARYQGMGFGKQALHLVVEHVRNRPGATELLTSVEPGPGNAQGFYEDFGFVATGEIEFGETVLRLTL